jgi:DNA-binding winged helix-turn-helix (wHTH) protein
MKYVFDRFSIDAAAREMLASGTPVPLEPKILDLLVCLIELRDRVVSKDELIEAVWNGRIITDAAISSAVSAARRALGDDGHRQRYVKTLHGRGFRFVCPLVEVVSEPPGIAGLPRDVGGHRQEIRYCHSVDGTRIAYALAGAGPPLVKAANWLHHLEFDWESPVWRHIFEELTSRHRLPSVSRRVPRGVGTGSSSRPAISS